MPNKKKYKKAVKNKPRLETIIKTLLLLLIILSLPVAYFLTTQNQDVRQQAASPYANCTEEDVNTEFRPFEEGTDKPWKSGDKMNVKIGDQIDVNCFAKTGTALLSNGKITLKVDGVKQDIPSSSIINNGRSLRGYEITQGGVHTFTCANTNCSDTDQINVPLPSPHPSATPIDDDIACTQDAKQCPDGSWVGRVPPSCQFAPCPSDGGTCPNPSVADINKDCKVDLKDYDLFLSEFIKKQ